MFAALREDLSISDIALGILGSVFLWSYALCSPVAGFLADRYSRSRIVAWSLALCSIFTVLTGASWGYSMLLVFLLCLGLAQGLYLPSAIALLADHHGPRTRGLAMGIHSVGLYFGMVIGGAFAGYLAEHFGWRSGFWVLGLVGVILTFCAKFVLRDNSKELIKPATPPSVVVALRYIAKVPSYHLLLAKTMLAGIGIWTFINWLPLYFSETFKMSLGMAGFAGMFMLQIPTMLGIATGGWISDRVAVRNARQRMLFQALCYFCAAPFLLPFLNRPGFILVTVAVSVFSLLRGLGQANENPILCDVIPPQFRSTAIGFMNCLSTAAGGAGVLLAGILKGGWGLNAVFAGISIIFVIAGAALLVGYFIFMPRDTQRARDYEVAMAAAAPIAPPDAARR